MPRAQNCFENIQDEAQNRCQEVKEARKLGERSEPENFLIIVKMKRKIAGI